MDLEFDPSANILYLQQEKLDKLFHPKSIAVIGASEKEGSVGRTLLWNLLKNPFGGAVYPVNPKRKSVLGIKAYPTILTVPEKVDLVVIAIPAKYVPEAISQCVEASVPTAVIISAGFKEMGQEGLLLEKKIEEIANGKMRIIGPNCLGVMNTTSGLNATFAADMALKGNIAFISQSGALCTAVLDWSIKEKIGFSSFISIGSMLDVDWGDLITYVGNDPNTKSILLYMESIGDTRSFLTAAREVALTKPIILIKAGRTEESAKAAASHTGALAASDEVLDAALQRLGILRVNSISELFDMAEILSNQPRPKGPKLSIITNAGGPGVIATDALIENKGELCALSSEIKSQLDQFLPKEWSHNNPIDILGDASPELYSKTMDVVINDPNTDGVLVVLTPQYMTDPTETAKKLGAFSKKLDKPILASWMGASSIEEGKKILADEKIPTFSFPDDACKTFAYMWTYSQNLKGIYEVPKPVFHYSEKERSEEQRKEIQNLFSEVKKEGRTLLSEYESKRVLEIFQIPTVPTCLAKNIQEAAEKAKKIGFPVVLKLYSHTITHKTDVGGVKLGLENEEAVKQAFNEIFTSVKEKAGEEHFLGVTVQPMITQEGYELILGSTIDPQFGPVLLFGCGGQLVEVFKDKSLALPPLTTTLAKRMMERTKIYEALKGVRGRESIDLLALEKLLVRFSLLVTEFPEIKEFDINPLLASPKSLLALDARIVLQDPSIPYEKLPRSAIRPYPIEHIEEYILKDNSSIVIRPIKPSDVPIAKQFLQDISKNAFIQAYKNKFELDDLVLIRLCFNDYDKEITLVAEKKNQEKREIVGVIRFSKVLQTKEATFTMFIEESSQGKGLGAKFLEKIIKIAKKEKILSLFVDVLPSNKVIQHLCEKQGFIIQDCDGSKYLRATKKLD